MTSRSCRWCLPVLVMLCTMVPIADTASAQELQASIIGQVKDESGSVLPGATVTTTSSALQVSSVTDVTNERGEYRLTNLPIGTYSVTFALDGFQTTKRDDLRRFRFLRLVN